MTRKQFLAAFAEDNYFTIHVMSEQYTNNNEATTSQYFVYKQEELLELESLVLE